MNRIRLASRFDPNADFVLYPGDCRDLLKQIPDGLVRLVVTSPPYNLGKPYEKRMHLSDYLEQQRQVIEECVRVLDDGGSLCWQVGNYVNDGEQLVYDIERLKRHFPAVPVKVILIDVDG